MDIMHLSAVEEAVSNIQSPKLLGIGFDGVVASCGAHIDFHKEIVYQVLLTEKAGDACTKCVKKYHMPVVLEGPSMCM